MAAILTILSVLLIWNAGLADWMVAYATGIAQLAVWCTLLSLIPFDSIWVSLKRMPFQENTHTESRAHWSILLKS